MALRQTGACLTLPAADGQIAQVLFGLEDETSKFRDPFRPAPCRACCLAVSIASPTRRMNRSPPSLPARHYRFSRYRKADTPDVKLRRRMALTLPIHRMAKRRPCPRSSIPGHDMGRRNWRWWLRSLPSAWCEFNCIVGDDLVRQNFPLIHASDGVAARRA